MFLGKPEYCFNGNACLLYNRWVHEQHLVHKGEGRDPPEGGSSFLPSMEAHILAGHKPRLMVRIVLRVAY